MKPVKRHEGLPKVRANVSELEQQHCAAVGKLLQLRDETQRREYAPQRFAEARTVLASLPLTQEEFGLASARLKNAETYLRALEWGAGGYELMLTSQTVKTATFCAPAQFLRGRCGSCQADCDPVARPRGIELAPPSRRIAGVFLAIAFALLSGKSAWPADAHKNDPRNSVVQIMANCHYPDLERPWNQNSPEQLSGTGTVIAGQQILTNAHLVLYARQILVRPFGSGSTFPATIVGIAPELDLALLKVDDPNLFKGRPPIPIMTKLPQTMQTVHVCGYPIGGAGLSVTKGVISRIEYGPIQGLDFGLRIQLDAALNPGNSGGPAIIGGRMVGLVYGFSAEGQNIGYVVSGYEIAAFLKDMRDGRYDGRHQLQDNWQPLHNEALRAKLGLARNVTGVLVSQPASVTAEYPLQAGDVLTKIGKYDIDDVGMIHPRRDLPLDFEVLVPALTHNGSVTFSVVRDGRAREVKVPVVRDLNPLLADLNGRAPRYFVFGPLAFSTATATHLTGFAPYLQILLLQESPLITRLQDSVAFQGEELVMVTCMLPHKTMVGYEDPSGNVVSRVNGVPIKNLPHLLAVLRSSTDRYIEMKFAEKYTETLVFDREEMARSTNAVIADNGIRQPCSRELANLWNAKPASAELRQVATR